MVGLAFHMLQVGLRENKVVLPHSSGGLLYFLELEGVIFLKNRFCKCLTHQECFLGQIICTIQPQIGKCKSSRSTETPTNEREDCTNSIYNEINNTLQPQHHGQSTV